MHSSDEKDEKKSLQKKKSEPAPVKRGRKLTARWQVRALTTFTGGSYESLPKSIYGIKKTFY